MRAPTALSMLICTLMTLGCTTVAVYQSPVAKYRDAVNATNDTVRPYLLNVNSLISRANLHDKMATNKPWGTEDLTDGIPDKELQLRLLALSTIAAHADALQALATSKAVDDLAVAATTLGTNVDGLAATAQAVTADRKKPAKGATAAQAQQLDIGGPLSALVKLFGTLAIEHMQKSALEAAILDGAKPVDDLIELLHKDLLAIRLVDETSYAAIRTNTVLNYNKLRHASDARGQLALIDELVAENKRLQALRSVPIEDLLGDMEKSHQALVTFAKSNKSPKSIGEVAAQIDSFTTHVALVQEAIASLETKK